MVGNNKGKSIGVAPGMLMSMPAMKEVEQTARDKGIEVDVDELMRHHQIGV